MPGRPGQRNGRDLTLRILVVEDEPAIADAVRAGLQADGHAVDLVGDGREALTWAETYAYDLVVLDIVLPGMSGLLLLARTDERLLAPPGEPSDLSVVVAEAVETFDLAQPGAANARMELAPDLLVAADPDVIRRILANLLDNAARYGGPTVHIRVTTSGSEREAVLDVADDGPGIAAADIERIFEPFYRVRADAGSPDGTGLGLALARSLAERDGGRLTVESRLGAGSKFRLALPRFR